MKLLERLNQILLSEMVHIDIGQNPYPNIPRWRKFYGLVDFELERLFDDQAEHVATEMIENGELNLENKERFKKEYKQRNLSAFYGSSWQGKATAEYMGDYIRFLPDKVVATTPQPDDFLLPHEWIYYISRHGRRIFEPHQTPFDSEVYKTEPFAGL